jgi:hypothetical protein
MKEYECNCLILNIKEYDRKCKKTRAVTATCITQPQKQPPTSQESPTFNMLFLDFNRTFITSTCASGEVLGTSSVLASTAAVLYLKPHPGSNELLNL